MVITDRSRPLGIMSGLSYLMWLNDKFIPQKQTPDAQPVYSKEANLHATIKNILSRIDPVTDQYYENNPRRRLELIRLLSNGNIPDVFRYLCDITNPFTNEEEKRTLKGLSEFSTDPIPGERIQQFTKIIGHLSSSLPNGVFLGNSVFLVLQKQ